MTDTKVVEPPPRWLTFLEQRALFELGAFAAASPALRMIGRGDHHPVLVLPGFTTSDRSTVPLRWVLRGQGYWVHGWHLGANLGPTRRIVEGLDDRLREVYERQGRTVSLIGWSLGGIYARQLARRHPQMVRQVITLGSPFRMAPNDRSAASVLWDELKWRYDQSYLDLLLASEDAREPLAVPATAIYSRSDGIVRWYTCIEAPGPRRENIEVSGSHSGLGVNPAVVLAIADRLAQREGEWRPFQPPCTVRHLYPRPATLRVVHTDEGAA
jgi:pimeloyl-ACP methyl ester carboxylesterase